MSEGPQLMVCGRESEDDVGGVSAEDFCLAGFRYHIDRTAVTLFSYHPGIIVLNSNLRVWLPLKILRYEVSACRLHATSNDQNNVCTEIIKIEAHTSTLRTMTIN